MDLLFGFWGFVIGITYLLVSRIKHEKWRANKEERYERSKAMADRYSIDIDDVYDFNHYMDNKWKIGEIMQEEIDAIVDANPSIDERYVIQEYYVKLLRAYFGFSHDYELSIKGGPLGIAESTALAQQIEKLMQRNGFKEFEYWFMPGDGYSINDYYHMPWGKFILREEAEIWYQNEPRKRMW